MKPHRVAVAYSGGRDSTALLHATLVASASLGVEVLALHVHHGLNPGADAWQAHCCAQCAAWARDGLPVKFFTLRLEGSPAPGDSIEAWAREARYQALAEMAKRQGAEIVLLAQHRRDQAETVLLQALRGAGVAGLSAMPRETMRDGLAWVRPWLDQPREAIDAYVRRHRLAHVDDDSNLDPRFARNRLRLEVWPALTHAFPQADAALADTANWAQQASACLAEIATQDLAGVAHGDQLDIAGWRTLSLARQTNALRAWLSARLGHAAPASLVARLGAELDAGSTRRWPAVDGELRSYRGRLSYAAVSRNERAQRVHAMPRGVAREQMLHVSRAGIRVLPGWGGRLRFTRVASDGVPLAWLAHAELRAREGAEQFQSGLGRPPRSLKKQYQAAGIPAWLRDGPLLYSGGQLVFVPGLGLDARILGLPGQALVTIEWVPFDASDDATTPRRRKLLRRKS